MNSFWHPPVLQGTKGACTSHFHLNQHCVLEVNLLTNSLSFHPGTGPGPALECANWAAPSATASGAALQTGRAAHSTALTLALGNSCAHSRWESAELVFLFPLKRCSPCSVRSRAPGEPRRGRGQLQTSLCTFCHCCCTEGGGWRLCLTPSPVLQWQHRRVRGQTHTDYFKCCSCRYVLC